MQIYYTVAIISLIPIFFIFCLTRSIDSYHTVIVATFLNPGPKYYNYSSLPSKPFCDIKHHFDKRYLALNMNAIVADNGLGNRLFEIFALRGLAKRLNRTAILNADDTTLMERIKDMNKTMPHIFSNIEIVAIERENTSGHTLIYQPQVYDYHRLFECDKSKFLVLNGLTYQSHHYFPEIREEILPLFNLEGEKKKFIENQVDEGDKNQFKSCVHVRRGDFGTGFLEASDANFTQKAVDFLRKKHKGVVYILNNDPDWVRQNVYDELEFQDQIHIMKVTSRRDAINDLYFSRMWCDAVMITAPASTFGWWIAYLAKRNKYIYYRDYFDTGDALKYRMVVEDYFHPNWTKTGYDENLEIVVKTRINEQFLKRK